MRWESVPNLTWAIPSAARLINSWRVTECETLSDHLYIEVVFRAARPVVLGRSRSGGLPDHGDGPLRSYVRTD